MADEKRMLESITHGREGTCVLDEGVDGNASEGNSQGEHAHVRRSSLFSNVEDQDSLL